MLRMVATAPSTPAQTASRRPAEYEQPLNERMRTFLRLELLYQQMLYNCELETDWATRAATACLLEIMAILTRGDVRSDVHKELDLQIENLQQFQSQPEVDTKRLGVLIGNLASSRDEVDAVGTKFLQPLKDSEFLSSIKHRSAIPGGTCEFDLPDYSHWLRRPYEERLKDLRHWMKNLRPLCDSIAELLWLLRRSGQNQIKTAENGVFHHSIEKKSTTGLLRVSMVTGTPLFPEISGGHHRISIRFMEWSDVEMRAVQTNHNVEFELIIC